MNPELNRDISTPPKHVTRAEQLIARIGGFAILVFLIYIVSDLSSIVLIRLGNTQFAAGNSQLGTGSYILALELKQRLKKIVNQCYSDVADQQYKLAIEDCSKAININKYHVAAYYNRALAHQNLQQPDQSIADFTKAIELVSAYTRAYVGRGFVYIAQGEFDLAIADCNKAIELDEEDLRVDASAYHCLGLAFYAQNNYDSALIHFDKAIDLSTANPRVYYLRGLIHDTQGRKESALADYTKAIEIDSNYGSAYSARGVLYAAQRNYDLAISDFSKAIEIDPINAGAYIGRGNAFADTKNFSQAITDYQKAISIATEANAISYAYCVQGITYTKMGDFEFAIPALEEGIKMDVTNEHGWCKTALENARQGIPTP
jgi:tetratricopeptide (TPR) repeat protein